MFFDFQKVCMLARYKNYNFTIKKMFRNSLIISITMLVLASACSSQLTRIIPHNHENLQYEGRVDTAFNSTMLYWPGSSVKIKLKGTHLKAILKDDSGQTYFNVLVDGKFHKIIKPGKEKKSYELASFPEATHTVELFRRTEFTTGTTQFFGFQTNQSAAILPMAPHKQKFVFYGNSITTGYANEDFSGQDRPDSIFTNNYMSYAAITSRHFDAEYHCIARGGIGFMVSWYPLIMPELFNRLNPHDAQSDWTFKGDLPTLVVVNLGQNDSWIVENPDMQEYQYRFGTKKITEADIIAHYRKFIQTLRNHYPDSPIICTLGSMSAVSPGSPWPGYIQKAVKQMEDENLYIHIFPYMATDSHPSVKDHQKMAKSLTEFIKKYGLMH